MLSRNPEHDSRSPVPQNVRTTYTNGPGRYTQIRDELVDEREFTKKLIELTEEITKETTSQIKQEIDKQANNIISNYNKQKEYHTIYQESHQNYNRLHLRLQRLLELEQQVNKVHYQLLKRQIERDGNLSTSISISSILSALEADSDEGEGTRTGDIPRDSGRDTEGTEGSTGIPTEEQE